MAHIIVEKGENKGKKITVGHDPIVIGRLKSNALTLNDAMSSRENTKIFTRDDRCYVTDLDSRNGTFLNGKQIQKETELEDGDVVQIGQTKIRFVDPSAPAPAKSSRRTVSENRPSRSRSGRAASASRKQTGKSGGIMKWILLVWFVVIAIAAKYMADMILPALVGK